MGVAGGAAWGVAGGVTVLWQGAWQWVQHVALVLYQDVLQCIGHFISGCMFREQTTIFTNLPPGYNRVQKKASCIPQ